MSARHQSAANRAAAGEVGAFVQRWRDMGIEPEIQMLKLPDGRGYDRRPDYSQMTAVKVSEMALLNVKAKRVV